MLGLIVGGPRVRGYRHSQAAQAAERAEDFELARAHLALCRRALPSNATYAYDAARVARRDGDFRSARALLSTAAELGQPAADVRLEELLAGVQEFGWRGRDQAIVDLLDQRPGDAARIHEVLARAYHKDLLLGLAIEHATAWAEAEPWSGNAWQLIGEIKELLRDRAGVMTAFRAAIDRNPALIRAQVGYAEALSRQLQPEAALEHFEAALRINPRDRDARFGLARTYVQLDRLADAAQITKGLVADRPQDGEVLGLAGRVALLDGRLEDAETWLTRSAARMKNLIVFQDLQMTLSRRGKVKAARELDDQIARLRDDFRRLDQLIEQARKSLEPAPRVEMAEILIRNGLEREGAAWLHDALRCSPGYRPAHAALADYFAGHGQADQADYHRRLAGRP